MEQARDVCGKYGSISILYFPHSTSTPQCASWLGILVFGAVAFGMALQLVLPHLLTNAANTSRTVLAINIVMTYVVSCVPCNTITFTHSLRGYT